MTSRDDQHNAEALAERIADFVNGGGRHDAAALVTALSHQHRTLQQGVAGLCLAWLKHLANLKEGQYDARNEASVLRAREVMSALGGDIYLPLI